MNTIADGLLIAGAIGAAYYCFILSRRLTQFTDLERGVGGAVAMLSIQVDDLTRALNEARNTAEVSGQTLAALTDRADTVARRLELQVVSLQDVTAMPIEPNPIPRARTGGTPTTRSFFQRAPIEEVA